MTVRSAKLASGTAVSPVATFVTVATVPAGERWLLKDATVRNTSAAANVVSIAVDTLRVWQKDLAAGAEDYMVGRFIVLEAGANLRMRAETSTSVVFYLSGAKLVL